MAGVLVQQASNPKELWNLFVSLSQYSGLVVLGLAILLFGFYPLLMKIFRVPIKYAHFYKSMSPAQFLAFSTSSSAATLPVTIECVENNLKIPKKVGTSFCQSVQQSIWMELHYTKRLPLFSWHNCTVLI